MLDALQTIHGEGGGGHVELPSEREIKWWIRKVKRVISSCVTKEQLKNGMKYTALMKKKALSTNMWRPYDIDALNEVARKTHLKYMDSYYEKR